MKRLTVCAVAAVACWTAVAGEKIVIAHRGASGYVPEHTLEGYAMAHALGAHYIEPDLVLTKDARFICVHDIYLEASTNVEEVFPERVRDDGHWYAADLTLEDVKRLQAHERRDGRFPPGKASFEVPTFEDMIELVQGLNATTGRIAGIYPELKEPKWHSENGLPMEHAFLELVRRYGYEGADAKIFVQCFHPQALMNMRELGSKLPQIMLISTSEKSDPLVAGPQAMDFIAKFANGIGPAKERIEANPELVQWAHDRGLVVHVYTLAPEDVLEPYENLETETRQFFFEYGVDGAFTDVPDKTRAVLDD